MINKFLHDMDLDGTPVDGEYENSYMISVNFDLLLDVVMQKSYLHNAVIYLGSTKLAYYSYHYVQGKWSLYKVTVFREDERVRVELKLIGHDIVVNNMSFVV